MIKAIVFDCFGVLLVDGVKNELLLNYIKLLRRDYKTGLLSNIISGGLETIFNTEELEQHFELRVASEDVGMAKPDPQIFELVCEKLGVTPEESVMIDDIPRYIEAAKAVGMKGIVYQDFVQMQQELDALLNSNN